MKLLLYVSSCKMLLFVMSYIKQNSSNKLSRVCSTDGKSSLIGRVTPLGGGGGGGGVEVVLTETVHMARAEKAQLIHLIVPFWFVSAIYQMNLPWFVV